MMRYVEPLLAPYAPDEAFRELFHAFTANSDSIGAHLTRQMMHLSADYPLLVGSGTDLALFPGGGRRPRIESFRNKHRGFIEIAAVSHVGTAVPWIIRQRELADSNWRADALRLIDKLIGVRAANSEAHWREVIRSPAYIGLEAKIAALVDYTCAVSIAFLKKGLADESLLTFTTVRQQYLDPKDSIAVPVPINDMMAATFGLAILDIAYRVIGWLRSEALDWERLMVVINGANGRLSGGLSVAKNHLYHLLWQASGQRFSPDQLYIVPYARPLNLAELNDAGKIEAAELEYRRVWHNLRANVELGRLMFEGYPAFRLPVQPATFLDEATTTVDRLPRIRAWNDRRAVMTNLRVVMEDVTELVSNAMAQFIIDQLGTNGNRPRDVVIPGFTHVTYPSR